MRLVNVTYKIYEFSELSEDVKTKVKIPCRTVKGMVLMFMVH